MPVLIRSGVMPRTIKFKGNTLTLVGRHLEAGDAAPDFRVVSLNLEEAGLSDFEGKIKVITTFPSIDTPVCDLQVKEFNKRAAGLSSEIVILGISKDLPFAQKRFCDSFSIKEIKLFSDYKFSSLGINYGLLIRELNLLARSVIILDKNNVIRYLQVAEELSIPLNYEEALATLKDVVQKPMLTVKEGGLPSKCVPCEGGVLALPKEKAEALIAQSRGWQIVEEKKIIKEFRFKDFSEAKYFVDIIACIAEGEGHHPTITIAYNKVKITLTTHAASGLTENDFIMSRIIDQIEA